MVVNDFVDILDMEMHTNTCVRVFVGRGGGLDGEPRLSLADLSRR